MEITVEIKYSYLLIKFNDVPQVFFLTERFIGFQTWIERPDKYVIEYSFLGGSIIKTEYNSKEKFDKILEELNNLLTTF